MVLLVLFEDSRRQAAELDNEFAMTNKLRGVLHGVPMSFKDQCTYLAYYTSSSRSLILNVSVDIAGYDSTIGFTQWTNQPSTDHATVSFTAPGTPDV